MRKRVIVVVLVLAFIVSFSSRFHPDTVDTFKQQERVEVRM